METAAPAAERGIDPKPWGIPAIAAVLAIPVALFAASFLVDAPEDLTTGEIVVGLVSTLVFKDALFIGLVAAFALWRYRLGWQGLGVRPFDRSLWWLPVVAAAAALVSVIVYSALLVGLGFDQPEQREVQTFFESNAALPLTGFALVIMAPLSEEIFFRGFIFPGLMRPLGLAGGMVASGILFGAFHITGSDTVALLLPFSAIGALFCWLYYRTGSLWPSIITHLLFNSVGFAVGAIGAQ